jgi:hypothetical protein
MRCKSDEENKMRNSMREVMSRIKGMLRNYLIHVARRPMREMLGTDGQMKHICR